MICTFCNTDREEVINLGVPGVRVCPVCIGRAVELKRQMPEGPICASCGKREGCSRSWWPRPRCYHHKFVLTADSADAHLCSVCVDLWAETFRFRGYEIPKE